jgi:hypothetical protein
MKLARLTIGRMMLVVAAVALNAALARTLYAWDPEILIGAALPLLTCELALLAALRRWRPGIAFWVTFLVCGSLAMATFIWDNLDPVVYGINILGQLINTPGSPAHRFWGFYRSFAADLLQPLMWIPAAHEPYSALSVGVRAAVWTVPQLGAGLTGGVLVWGVSRAIGAIGIAEPTRRRPMARASQAGHAIPANSV